LVRLTAFDGPHTGTPRWAPDGRHLAFTVHGEGQADIYVVDREGSLPRRLTRDAAIDVAPSWSQDGQWIYFGSNRGGTWQIWKMAAAGGEALPVTAHGGFVGFEAPDGLALYYTRHDTVGIWQQPLDGGAPHLVLDNLDAVHAGNWAVAEAGLYFVNRKHKPATIDFYDFATGAISSVAVPGKEPAWQQHAFSVAPDGEIFYARVDHSHFDVMVVDYRP